MTLEQLIHDAAKRAEQQLQSGFVPITFIGYRPDSNPGFMFDEETLQDFHHGREPIMEDADRAKDFMVFMAKTYLAVFGCIQVVQYSEAWQAVFTTASEAEDAIKAGISNRSDRIDVMHYVAEDLDNNRFNAVQEILRPVGSPAYLGPLKIEDGTDVKGRFTGFFLEKKLQVRLHRGLHRARRRAAMRSHD